MDLRSSRCFAGITKTGSRANTSASANNVEEACGEVNSIIGIGRNALYSFSRCVLSFFRVAIGFRFYVYRLRTARVLRALRPRFLLLHSVVVYRTGVLRCLFIAYLRDLVFLVRIFRGVARARSSADDLIAMYQPGALSNHACFDLSFHYLMYAIGRAVNERSRVYALASIRALLRVVSNDFRFTYLHRRGIKDCRAAIASSICLVFYGST